MKLRHSSPEMTSSQAGQPEWVCELPSAVSHHQLGLYVGSVPLGKPRRYGTPFAYRGVHASTKCLGMPIFESLLERDFQTILCCDPRVQKYAVQSHQLTYWTPAPLGARMSRIYTPDLTVLLRDGTMMVVEVKAEAFARTKSWKTREPYIRKAYARDHAVNFVVVTERLIRVQPRLSNFEKMLRYGGRFDDQQAIMAIRDAIYRLPTTASIGQICESAAFSDERMARGYSAVMHLALVGEIALDHRLSLSLATTVTRSRDA